MGDAVGGGKRWMMGELYKHGFGIPWIWHCEFNDTPICKRRSLGKF